MVIHGLSKREVKLMSYLELYKKNIITADDVKKILKTTKQKAFEIVHHLKKKQRLIQIKKGKYILVPIKAVDMHWSEHPFLIAPVFAPQYYISYRTALNFYGFTEQVPIVIYIACLRYRKPINLVNTKFQFVQLNKNKFFGYEEKQIDNKKIYFADKEKTLIDCLDKQHYGGSVIDIAKGLFRARKEVNLNKLIKYALRMKNKSLTKRLGYLLELLKIKFNKKNLLDKIRNDEKYVPLSTAFPSKGKLDKKWKIIKNIPNEQLLNWQREL